MYCTYGSNVIHIARLEKSFGWFYYGLYSSSYESCADTLLILCSIRVVFLLHLLLLQVEFQHVNVAHEIIFVWIGFLYFANYAYPMFVKNVKPHRHHLHQLCTKWYRFRFRFGLIHLSKFYGNICAFLMNVHRMITQSFVYK